MELDSLLPGEGRQHVSPARGALRRGVYRSFCRAGVGAASGLHERLDEPSASFGNTGLLADCAWPYTARAGADGNPFVLFGNPAISLGPLQIQ